MKRLLVISQLTWWVGIVLAGTGRTLAQDAEMLRHFDYDQKAAIEMKQIGAEEREHAIIYDITYASSKGGVVPAYLVVPKGKGPFPAVIWGHWYLENSPMRNRKEFLDEAVALAQVGVVSPSFGPSR